jgi:hypothetical protein
VTSSSRCCPFARTDTRWAATFHGSATPWSSTAWSRSCAATRSGERQQSSSSLPWPASSSPSAASCAAHGPSTVWDTRPRRPRIR